MKIFALGFTLTAVVFAGALVGAGQGLATAAHRTAPKTLNVVMHDPGCHWFQVHGKFAKSATVTGSVRLVDRDEAALKVASSHGMRRIPVGKSIVVDRGSYVIMMVGQAVDDNYLKLTVR
jgi:hypothetical protein